MTISNYSLKDIPDYRKPLIIALIQGSDIWDGFDTPENIDKLACQILDTVQATHMLEQHVTTQG